MPVDGPVESGKDYLVIEVDGREPRSFDDFDGDIHLTLARNDRLLHVTGSGSTADGHARFYQKKVQLLDQDIRVWDITAGDGTVFLASPFAAF